MRILFLSDTHYGFSDTGNKRNITMLEKIRGIDCIVHCGDIGSHEPYHINGYYKNLRYYFPNLPILVTMGNHDLWNRYAKKIEDVIDENLRTAKEHSILYLGEHSPLLLNGVYITGFDSWYSDDVITNDNTYIPQYNLIGKEFLRNRSEQGMARCLGEVKDAKEKGYKTVLVTHFNFVEASLGKFSTYMGAPRSWENFLINVDVLAFGHNHIPLFEKSKKGNTFFVNPGSDYENPKYCILELGETP